MSFNSFEIIYKAKKSRRKNGKKCIKMKKKMKKNETYNFVIIFRRITKKIKM